ncbi:MAG: 50S ribosomal protein L15 [Bacteroidales bacterium]
MDLNSLKPAKGSTKNRKRIARGQGSGFGGTSTRGHKGAKSRSGYKQKRGFEGGQMPLQRVVPKFGFKSLSKVVYKPINIGVLQQLADESKITEIDIRVLTDAGLISKNDRVKILGTGDLKAKLSVKAHACSKSAQEKIEKASGNIEIIEHEKTN